MSTKNSPKRTELKSVTKTRERKNYLTPAPVKEVKISKSYLEDEDSDFSEEEVTNHNNTPNNEEVKVEVKVEVKKEEVKENKESKREESRREESVSERSSNHVYKSNKGSIITIENVLAKYGYKSMEKLVLNNKIIYVRCINTEGHTVFVDMQNSDYENEDESENIVNVSTVDKNDIEKDIKEKSYECIETDINGILIIYENYYTTLTREGHRIEPKETTYVRNNLNSNFNSDNLIPFPIIGFEEIFEDNDVVNEYVYNVTNRIYKQFYKCYGENIVSLTEKIDKMNTLVTDFETDIINKVKENNDLIVKLENFKLELDEMEGEMSKENRTKLRLIIFNLRILHIIERENIATLKTLGTYEKTMVELIVKLETDRSEYKEVIENLINKREEYDI